MQTEETRNTIIKAEAAPLMGGLAAVRGGEYAEQL